MTPDGPGRGLLFDADDLLLFSVSPFAFWMERSRLELGEAGPAPDPGSAPPAPTLQSQAGLSSHLSGQVSVIPWHSVETERRLATLEAMRAGVDWIIDGQLSQGGFTATCNLLKREAALAGKAVYVPCMTQQADLATARLHLCLQADLLDQLQNWLPEEVLLLHEGRVAQSWSTACWLPVFRAFRDRFLAEQASFDPGLPPDPSASMEHGRWQQQALLRLGRQQSQLDGRMNAGLNSRGTAEPDSRVTTRPEPRVTAQEVLPRKEHPLDSPGFSFSPSGSRPQAASSPADRLAPFSSTLDTRDLLAD